MATACYFNDVLEHIKNGIGMIIDVRYPEEIERTGTFPNSVNIPDKSVRDLQLDTSDFKNKYGFDKPKSDSPIIFADINGRRAEKACKIAEKMEYKNVQFYRGGLNDWLRKGGDICDLKGVLKKEDNEMSICESRVSSRIVDWLEDCRLCQEVRKSVRHLKPHSILNKCPESDSLKSMYVFKTKGISWNKENTISMDIDDGCWEEDRRQTGYNKKILVVPRHGENCKSCIRVGKYGKSCNNEKSDDKDKSGEEKQDKKEDDKKSDDKDKSREGKDGKSEDDKKCHGEKRKTTDGEKCNNGCPDKKVKKTKANEDVSKTSTEAENSKDKNSKDENSKDENSKDKNSKKEDSKKEDSKKEDSKKEDSKKEDSKNENSKDKDSKDENCKEKDANCKNKNCKNKNSKNKNCKHRC